MLILFLIIHGCICILVGMLIKTKKIDVSVTIFPAVCFLPICGLLMLCMEVWTNEKRIRASKEVGLGKLLIDDVKYRQIAVTEDASHSGAVPLEEAFLVNDTFVKRKLLMEVLQHNPEDYIELLKKARMSNDTELTHYATTTMMEIQSGYELSIHDLEEELKKENSYESVSRYKNLLGRYIDSGLISGSILDIYRKKMGEALEHLIMLDGENRKNIWECIENHIELKNWEQAGKLLETGMEKWPDDEKIYQLYVDYYWNRSEGAKIPQVLERIKNNNVYLSSQGKKWFDFWEKKEKIQ